MDNFDIRKMLSRIRQLDESVNRDKKMLNEADDKKKSDAIAITNDARFGQDVLQSQIDEFRSSVDSGAQFTTPDENDVASSPLIYMPSNRNVIFSGIIPSLNNLKFQFVLRTTTGNGCFIWSDGLILNKDNIQILNKLYGFYSNWIDQWNSESKDLDTIMSNNED